MTMSKINMQLNNISGSIFCILLLGLFFLVGPVGEANAGSYKIYWGTNATYSQGNGTGGTLKFNGASISSGDSVTVSDNDKITITYTPGYTINSGDVHRYDSDFGGSITCRDNTDKCELDQNTKPYEIIFKDSSSNAKIVVIKFTAASTGSGDVFTKWGTTGSYTGDGGSVSSSGRSVANQANVSPKFNNNDTATFTMTPDSGFRVKSVELREGGDGSNNWNALIVTNNQVSFDINSKAWAIRVTFEEAPLAQKSFIAYYGTNAFDLTSGNKPNWNGGSIVRNVGGSTEVLGTSAYKVSDYTVNGIKTFTVTTDNSPAHVIDYIQYCKATWTNPRTVTLDVSDSWHSVSVDSNGQFTIPVTGDSYIIFVKFKLQTGTGGTVGAWYGTTNSTGFNTPAANGSGGSVWKTSGTDVQLDNAVPDAYSTTSDGNRTFTVNPANNFRIVQIKYGIGATPGAWTDVAVGANQTTNVDFVINLTGGNQYVIWVVFASTAASSFTVTGSVDMTSPPECLFADTTTMISPNSQIVNINATGTFTFSTTAGCMVESVDFNTLGPQAWSTLSWTTPAITMNSAFKVKFRTIGYNIIVEKDAGSASGCGETISPSGTIAVSKGGELKVVFTSGTCIVSHIYVTDTNKGYSGADIAPLVPAEYTFKNVQANGRITIMYSEVVPTSSDAYCQIPPFVAGQASLAPNVLIVFDNSGSMGGSDSDGYAYYNNKTYGCTAPGGANPTLDSGLCVRFYGYFDPEKMYKVDPGNSNKYLIDTATLDLSSSNGKSGNYLNYRNMHKVDIIRKALMGGRIVDRAAAIKYLSTDNGKTLQHGTIAPTGIVQQLASKVRFGIMVFNNPAEGGHLAKIPSTTRVAKIGSSEADLVAALEGADTDPKTSTPIAETLYEGIRYFQAKPSAYNDGVDYGTMDPIQNSCQKHFILLLTDGEPNSSQNLPGYSTHPAMNGYNDGVFNVTEWEGRILANDKADNNNSTCFTPNSNYYKCPAGSANACNTNSEKVEAVAFYMHNTDLRSEAYSNTLPGKQNITLFPVYAFGNGTGTKTLQMAAKYGGYNNKNGNNPSPNSYPSPDSREEWDVNPAGGDCIPDNYFEAEDGAALEASLMTTMSNILAKVASGTAASILSNSEGSGANMLQAVFFPNKIFENSTEVNWIGEMQNLWYYVDPFIGNSSVREDTDYVSGNHELNLRSDYTANFYFDTNENVTRVKLLEDTNGDGVGEVDKGNVPTDDVKSIWRAGKKLFARTAGSRTIHTSINGTSLLTYPIESPLQGGFAADDSRAASLQPYIQAADNDSNAEAKKIISYIRGTDQTNYRNRKVSLTAADTLADWKEWKLGDIISSTPRIQSTFRLNQYSLETPTGYGDVSYYKFINTGNYKNRGMVYVGANDGMLHAFKMGKLTITGSDIIGDTRAVLSGTNLGEEQWAYIPRNALPYLKYFTEKDTYKHIYYVDGQTVVSDVAIGSCGVGDYSDCPKDEIAGDNWRTVLIGSMGLGGASKLKATAACVDGVDGTCVKTPIFDPTDTTKSKGIGYSSYFALDVTNQYYNVSGELANQPTLKWEFADPELGYSTSGVAIVKINAKTTTAGVTVQDKSKNGKWFAVFASGPTGPIDTTNHRFMARSNQNLKIFIVDLGATGALTLGSNYWVKDTGIKYAFGGSMLPAVIDADRWNPMLDGNYSDDALYVGYTKANSDPLTALTKWSDGGVLRVLTKEDPNPANWTVSKVIDGIGPVTTGINRLQDRKNKKLWLYWGTGRYFYTDDDSTNIRHLMGVQDRCYTSNNNIDPNCNTVVAPGDDPEGTGKGGVLSFSDLSNNTYSCNTLAGKKGWYTTLWPENTDAQLAAERSITDAVPMGSGMVLYTTFMPTTDVCKFGGNSYMWALKYDDGCLPPCSSLGETKVMIQMSTGSFEQMDLNDIFACSPCSGCAPQLPPVEPPEGHWDGGREVESGPKMIGKPPTDPPSSIPAFLNPPLKKILHIKEK
jgi:type IV pilus assembly protein PilY1